MYLKALNLYGFKSFPEKTTLTFEKPVTAIVGPNGSGKSNIADALQWVMGEQSTKALRGGKMEDVIFGGTEKRGQVGFAEVTLVLDNSDGRLDSETDEVEVTRRYYRSGDSEYYINKKQVRLRDINELFMDTGLGRDGYSIIGQGKVDSILSAKSTDRREIFEEAAGISRFRHRKEESERRLQHAEDDLIRVNDKISELELQVEPLRKQSETAKRYLLLRDELRGLEINLWLRDLDDLAERNKKLNEDALSSQGAIEKARADLDNVYLAAERLTEKMHEKELEAERVRGRQSQEEARLADCESRAAVLRTQIEHNKENEERIDRELMRQDDQSASLQSQIDDHTRRMGEIDLESKAARERIEELRLRSARLSESETAAQRQLVELDSALSSVRTELGAARSALTGIAASMQEVDDRDSSLISEINSEADRLAQTKEQAEKNRREIQEAEEKLQSASNIVSGYLLRVDGRRKKSEATGEKAISLRMDYNALKSRIQLLSDMEKEYEGYSKAVKTVMRESSRGTLRGIHGPAGELIKAENRYALAIETAMGAAMQHIIVGTDGDGKAAINLLKRLDAGRVTLLPMNVITGSRLQERGLEGQEGFEGIAADLVSFDRQYQNIYLNLLGRTVIVSDMDCALRIARQFNHRFRIVTLDGQVINAGGSMTGGSTSKNTGILSRANELTALSQREKKLGEELEEIQRRLETEKRELSAAEYELKVAEGDKREAEDSLVKLRSDMEHYDLLLSSLGEHLQSLRDEKASSGSRAEQLRRQAHETRRTIEGLESREKELEAESEKASGGREELSKERRELMDSEAEERARLASFEAERVTHEGAVRELDDVRRGLVGDRSQRQEAAQALKLQAKELSADLEKNRAEGELIRAGIDRLKNKVSSISEEKMAIEAERTRTDKAAQDMNRRLLDLEREGSRVEQKLQAAQMEEKQIVDKLWDSYELTRTTARQEQTELASYPAAKKRTGELRRAMSALGTPNLGAIEEFERVNTRYTYLTDQRNDIEKSRTELLGIIDDITSQMKDIFKEEFYKINESFKETFLELFGGGKASIELEDEDNILECGIEIKVQPPGKSLKTITLLSGGEKAFVAIALYYSILKIRPTPFVIMDEIEAALDEANVARTASYMRRLCDKTQFLVITHRRGTMEEADVLFGVTMQEQGVSKVLKMDIDEAEKTIRKD